MRSKTARLEMIAEEYDLPLSGRAINFLFERGILTPDALANTNLHILCKANCAGPITKAELREAQKILLAKL
ncbi:MAG: hypothetical protein JST51_10340 [Armatimonadetes bacterium]|nr:hypothetical protein [Armatimonadota bacterium]